jgi:hypothetical protein
MALIYSVVVLPYKRKKKEITVSKLSAWTARTQRTSEQTRLQGRPDRRSIVVLLEQVGKLALELVPVEHRVLRAAQC